MKNIIVILILMLGTNIAFSEKDCSTGYACPLDKLKEIEKSEQEKKLINETQQLKSPEIINISLKNKQKKDYKDYFIFTNPKAN